MNVYDSAHALARAIKESEDYNNYKKLSEEVKKNSILADQLKAFQEKQLSLQKAQMLGESLNQNEVDAAQKIYDEMMKDSVMAAYFAAEMKISQILGDVSKIIGDAMDFR